MHRLLQARPDCLCPKSLLPWSTDFVRHSVINFVLGLGSNRQDTYVFWGLLKWRPLLHDHPRVAQHMDYRCEIIAVWSATAAMTPLCSHTNGMKQRYPTCWLCQYSRFMIDLRSNTLIIHLRCSDNDINRPIWLPDARMLKTISVAIKLT